MDDFGFWVCSTLVFVAGFLIGGLVSIESNIADTNNRVCSQLYLKTKGYKSCLKRKDINKNIEMIRSIDNDR